LYVAVYNQIKTVSVNGETLFHKILEKAKYTARTTVANDNNLFLLMVLFFPESVSDCESREKPYASIQQSIEEKSGTKVS